MKNCIVKSQLISNGESIVTTCKGELSKQGNFTRINYTYEKDGSIVNSEIILLQSNSVKLKVSGDSKYSVTLTEGVSSDFSINVGGYILNSVMYAEVVKIEKQNSSLNIYLKYQVMFGGEKNNTELYLQVEYDSWVFWTRIF